MTRIAFISDTHSNVPATTAVLKHIEKNNIDLVYSLGDMIGKGPSPAEVVDLHRKHCSVNILGNWEDFLLNSSAASNPIRYYRKKLNTNQMEFLHSLGYNIEFYMSGRFVRVFHAHPDSVYKRVFRNVPLHAHLEMFLPPEVYKTRFPGKIADIAIYGDIHYPYSILFDEAYFRRYFQKLGTMIFNSYEDFQIYHADLLSFLRGRAIYNAGSVGQPFGNTLASYLLLEGKLHSEILSDLEISFVTVPYDNLLASKIALQSNMMDRKEYSNEILTGIFRGYNPRSKIIKLL